MGRGQASEGSSRPNPDVGEIGLGTRRDISRLSLETYETRRLETFDRDFSLVVSCRYLCETVLRQGDSR